MIMNVFPKKIMLLGSGELGKEVAIAAKRLGCYVIACDRYNNAPAMQIADQFEVLNMNNENKLKEVIYKYNPDIIQGWMYVGNIIASVLGFGNNLNICHSVRASNMDQKRYGRKIWLNSIMSKSARVVIAAAIASLPLATCQS